MALFVNKSMFVLFISVVGVGGEYVNHNSKTVNVR